MRIPTPFTGDAPHAEVERTFPIYENQPEYLAWPAIARTAEGDILVLYTSTEEHLGPCGKIKMSRSKDNGETWEDPVTIFDTVIDDRESGITALRDGTLMTFYWSTHWNAQTYKDLPEWAYHQEVIDTWVERVNQEDYLKSAHLHGAWNAISQDGGYTWSDPVKGKDSIHGGVELQSGKIIVAAYRQQGENINILTCEEPLGPWTRIATVVTPRPREIRFGEPHLTQLKKGRIILLLRATAIPYDDKSPKSYVWMSYSDDDGENWVEPYPTPLWGFPPHVTQLSDGRVLATYGHRRPPYGERACLSAEGITWHKEDELILNGDAPGIDLGYPVSLELEPGRVLTVYYQPNVPPGSKPKNHPPDPDRIKVGILGTIWKVPPKRDIPNLTKLGQRRELFVDGKIIESLDNTRLRLHHPHREGPAVSCDAPWEGRFSGYPTVLKDGDHYRLYYRGWDNKEEKGKAITCYAESSDGISWSKPELNLFEVSGSKANNVILTEAPFTHNFSPFLDTRPGVPQEERYKAVAGEEKSGLFGFVSADGIHWEKVRDEPLLTQGLFDSQNVVFWSESEACYVCYFRTWTGDGYSGYRTISRATSPDFHQWTDGAAMHFGDTPMEQLYTNGTHPYFRAPHIYLALAKRFFQGQRCVPRELGEKLVEDPEYARHSSDSILMSSRGGYEYDRTFMEAFIRPGESPRDWISRDNAPAFGVVPGDARSLFIYVLSHYGQKSIHFARYSLRLDGFASVEAPYPGGSITTKLFSFEGNRLEINFQSSAYGSIEVEILDPDGNPRRDFARADSEEIRGDEISRTVSWKTGSDVSSLAGQPIRLRFWMRDANLFSFRFYQEK